MSKTTYTSSGARERARLNADRRRRILYCDLPTEARVIWLYLLDRKGENLSTWPSEARICADLKLHLRRVQRHLCRLERAGAMRVSRARGRANKYFLTDPLHLLTEAGGWMRPDQSSDTSVTTSEPTSDTSVTTSAASSDANVAQLATPVSPDRRHQCHYSSDTSVAQNVVRNGSTEQVQGTGERCAFPTQQHDNTPETTTANLDRQQLDPMHDWPADRKVLVQRTLAKVVDALSLGDAYVDVQGELTDALAACLHLGVSNADIMVRYITAAAGQAAERCKQKRWDKPADRVGELRRRLQRLTPTTTARTGGSRNSRSSEPDAYRLGEVLTRG